MTVAVRRAVRKLSQEASMLSKCANPACSARFRYLHEGRIFNIEITTPATDPPMHRLEHYWLCGCCAKSLKVVLYKGVATTRPLHLELPAAEDEEEFEEEPQLA
jgi:hypothetical protein